MENTVCICNDLTWRDLNGELVVLNSKNGDYHIFNKVGRVIWLAVAEKKSDDEIKALVIDEFDIDSKTALNDIRNFIKDMTHRNLFEEKKSE